MGVFLLVLGLIGVVSGQVDRGVCNARGRIVGGDCVCDQFYADATSANPAFEIVKSGDSKVYARSPATGGLVVTSVINNALIFTKTDDGALRVSDGPESDQPIRGQCLLAPQLGGTIVFGNCDNVRRINDVQFPADESAGMLLASSVQWQSQCTNAGEGCSILNHGGGTIAAEQNRIIFYINHGDVRRVYQQQRLLEDQRCAVYDPTLGSTTTTTTGNREITTTVTQTTHTANFSNYNEGITQLMSAVGIMSTQMDALTRRLDTVENENADLASTVASQTTQIATGQSTQAALRSTIAAALSSLPPARPAEEIICEASEDGAVPARCRPSIEAQGLNVVLRAPGGTVRVDTDTCGSVSVCETLVALDTLKRSLQ